MILSWLSVVKKYEKEQQMNVTENENIIITYNNKKKEGEEELKKENKSKRDINKKTRK